MDNIFLVRAKAAENLLPYDIKQLEFWFQKKKWLKAEV